MSGRVLCRRGTRELHASSWRVSCRQVSGIARCCILAAKLKVVEVSIVGMGEGDFVTARLARHSKRTHTCQQRWWQYERKCSGCWPMELHNCVKHFELRPDEPETGRAFAAEPPSKMAAHHMAAAQCWRKRASRNRTLRPAAPTCSNMDHLYLKYLRAADANISTSSSTCCGPRPPVPITQGCTAARRPPH